MGCVLLAAAAARFEPCSVVFQMISHGLISALLFLLSGCRLQRRVSRDLDILQGAGPRDSLP